MSLKTVQLSSTSSELCSSALKRPLAVLFQLGDIQSLWNFLALWSSYRLNGQVEFAVNKPVICPTVYTTHSLCHSDIRSVLSSYNDTYIEPILVPYSSRRSTWETQGSNICITWYHFEIHLYRIMWVLSQGSVYIWTKLKQSNSAIKWETVPYEMCSHWRLRSACASACYDQCFNGLPEETMVFGFLQGVQQRHRQDCADEMPNLIVREKKKKNIIIFHLIT